MESIERRTRALSLGDHNTHEECENAFCETCHCQKCMGCNPCGTMNEGPSEPFFELEPESEEIPVLPSSESAVSFSKSCQMHSHHIQERPALPIHVPLSATYATDSELHKRTSEELQSQDACMHTVSPTSSTSLTSTDYTSCSTQHGDDDQGESQHHQQHPFPLAFFQWNHSLTPHLNRDDTANHGENTSANDNNINNKGCCGWCQNYAMGKTPCPSCGVKYCHDDFCQTQLFDNGTCIACCKTNDAPTTRSQSRSQQVRALSPLPPIATGNPTDHAMDSIPMTPPQRSRTKSADYLLEAPVTPDAGCCTACQHYATGKQPCRSCGTKYCHSPTCQKYLYDNGTCVKCRAKTNTLLA